MIVAIAKQGFPVAQHPQLSWDSMSSAWPTGLLTSDYSYDAQLQPQELPLLAIGNSVTLDLQVSELSLLWNQTSHSDMSTCFVPYFKPQNNDQAVKLERNYDELPAAYTANDRKQLHNTEIFSRGWPDKAPDTICGWGSSERHTRLVRREFVELLKNYYVKTLNDAGCGDLAWMSMIDLEEVDYAGYDLYERANWADLRQREYRLDVLDITENELRPADLLICRDVFIHLPNDMVLATLERFRRSASLLLTTSYTSDLSVREGEFSNFRRMDEPNLHHRKLDLTLPPFNLGQPLLRIPEDSHNKYLGLWDMSLLQSCLDE